MTGQDLSSSVWEDSVAHVLCSSWPSSWCDRGKRPTRSISSTRTTDGGSFEELVALASVKLFKVRSLRFVHRSRVCSRAHGDMPGNVELSQRRLNRTTIDSSNDPLVPGNSKEDCAVLRRKIGARFVSWLANKGKNIVLLLLGILSLSLLVDVYITIRNTIDPTEFIRPEDYVEGSTIFGDHDDLSVGKSCNRKGGKWRCRHCVNGDCQPLRPSGRCKEFRMQEWDSPLPRAQSYYNQYSDGNGMTRLLTRFGYKKVRKTFYEQAMCSVSQPECFDLSRCSIPISIYMNDSKHQDLLDYAVSQQPELIRKAQAPKDACLTVLVGEEQLFEGHSWAEVRRSPSWQNGKNHFIWLQGCHWHPCDLAFIDVNFELASVASFSITSAHVRPGFDMPIPFNQNWGRSFPFDDLDLDSDRKYIVSFKGQTQSTLQPYYQHRWLAREFWEESSDVVVDVACLKRTTGLIRKKRQVLIEPYKLPRETYGDILLNSTFGFAPGGSSVGSFRFGEILASGGIPVVTQDALPPFSPEIDWSKCVFRISDARIIDLPRILRRIPNDEVKRRRKECARLYRSTMGETKSGNVWRENVGELFTTAMEVWSVRIRNALYAQENLIAMNNRT